MSLSRRALLSLTVLLAAIPGCVTDGSEDAAGNPPPGGAPSDDSGGGNEGDPGAPAGGCTEDWQCEPAATSCCECPSFAQSVDDGFGDSCEDVDCEMPADCPETRAVCAPAGQCVLACTPVVCELSCPGGFAVDAAGCQTCSCAPAPAAEEACASDDGCAAVPADCCGCERGGADTAVLVDRVAAHLDALGCQPGGVCPEVDICEAAEVPRCLASRCVLIDPPSGGEDPSLAGQFCGAPGLPACPAGEACVLNDPSAVDASAAGVGVCRSQ